LSNLQALQLFLEHRPAFMSHLLLSHLSANNNSPRIVKELFGGVAGRTEIIVATRYKETGVFEISGVPVNGKKFQVQQLSLWERA